VPDADDRQLCNSPQCPSEAVPFEQLTAGYVVGAAWRWCTARVGVR
jgi:hypothetical protein